FSIPKPIATVRTRFFRTTRNAGISPGAAATLKVNTDDVIRGDLICQSSADRQNMNSPACAIVREGRGGVASIQNTNAHQGNGILLFYQTHISLVLTMILHCRPHGSRNPTSQEHGIMFLIAEPRGERPSARRVAIKNSSSF